MDSFPEPGERRNISLEDLYVDSGYSGETVYEAAAVTNISMQYTTRT